MELPSAPANMRTQWRTEGERLVLDLPRAGFSMAEFAPLVAMGIVTTIIGASGFACFLIFIARRADIGTGFKWFAGACFAVFCFLVPMLIGCQGVLWPVFRRTRVIASAGSLRVERRLGFLRRSKEIPAGALAELALTRVRTPAVSARGGKSAVRFGQGLPEAELEWVRAAVAKVLGK